MGYDRSGLSPIKNTLIVTGLGADKKPMLIPEAKSDVRIAQQVQEGVDRPKATVLRGRREGHGQ